MVHQAHNFTLDSAIQMKDAGAMTSTAITQVGGSNKALDLGAATYQRFALVVDVSAIDTANGDESYTITVQGSSASGFSPLYILTRTILGDSSVSGNAIDTLPGRYVIYGDNVINLAGSQTANAQYLRVSVGIAGTTPSINFQAWFVPIA